MRPVRQIVTAGAAMGDWLQDGTDREWSFRCGRFGDKQGPALSPRARKM